MIEDYGKDEWGDPMTPAEARRRELEKEFSFDSYQVVRKELFAHLRDPAVTVRDGNITFNTACIDGLEDVVYVHLMFSEELHRLVVRKCDENDKEALRWCVAKPDKRKSRKMTCPKFTDLIYHTMKWDKGCRYKMLGYRIEVNGETLYVFDFEVPEIFVEKKRAKKNTDGEGSTVPDTAPETSTDTDEPVNTRKGYYSDDIAGTFGLPFDDFKKSTEVRDLNGYTSVGMLTGKK